MRGSSGWFVAAAGLAVALAGLWPEGVTHAQDTDKGDLALIKKRGVLRVIIRQPESYLPREGSPLAGERQLAEAFASRMNLRVEFVVAPSRAELIRWLKEGRGDIVAASLQITPERA